MTLLSQLASCDGFTVESPAGCIGWVEETWLDDRGQPAALALRTPDGSRALLLVADNIRAIDLDTQEVFVVPNPVVRRLEPPRFEIVDGDPTASWRASGALAPVPTAATVAPPAAVGLGAARVDTASPPKPPWQIAATMVVGLALLVAFEIGLVFGIAYLVTGRLT